MKISVIIPAFNEEQAIGEVVGAVPLDRTRKETDGPVRRGRACRDRLVRARLGGVLFLVLYFGAELTAHALTMYYHKDDPYYSAIGASGAISGVVFAFCLYRPFAMLGIMFVIPMPAILFAVLYVVGSIYAMKRSRH